MRSSLDVTGKMAPRTGPRDHHVTQRLLEEASALEEPPPKEAEKVAEEEPGSPAEDEDAMANWQIGAII